LQESGRFLALACARFAVLLQQGTIDFERHNSAPSEYTQITNFYRLRRRVQLVAGWANGDTIIDGAKFKLLLRACECPSSVQFIVNQGSTIERSRFSKN
jgi:hypothetical protein